MMDLTQEIIRKLVKYNPNTGIMTWRERPLEYCKNMHVKRMCDSRFEGRAVGHVAEIPNRPTCLQARIFGKLYYVHRLVWLYVYGEFPAEGIDHIDGDATNNRIDNLREASQLVNGKNLGVKSNNTSGIPGVSWMKSLGKWRAFINVNYRQINLGLHDDIESAAQARLAAEKKYGFHENHGKRLSCGAR